MLYRINSTEFEPSIIATEARSFWLDEIDIWYQREGIWAD